MRKQILHVFCGLMLGLLTVSFFALFPHEAGATNPNLVNFQGKVVNGSGSGSPDTNVTDGSYTFRFCLYSTATPTTPCTAGANNDALWRESKSLTVTSGVFQTELGDVTTLPDFSSNSNLYLGVNFNGDAAGEMTPRIHLDSVPFAKYSDNSGQLGGLAAANFVQLAQGLQADSSTTNASIAINKTNASGTPNILTLQKSGANVMLIDNNGLFTLQPAAAFTGTGTQNAISQTLTSNQTGGTVNGYSQSITVSNSSGAATTNGLSISISDSTSNSNIATGISVTVFGSNASQSDIGISSNSGHGVGIIGTSSGVPGGLINCGGVNAAWTVGVCGATNGTTKASGVFGVSGGNTTDALTSNNGDAGVFGYTFPSGTAASVYEGVKGVSNQSNNAAYTSVGVYGRAKGGTGASVYGGYFGLDSGSTATSGAALYATNSTVAANIMDLQDNTTSVFTVGDGGVTTAKSNSSTGFQIQDSSSSKQVLTIDTSGDQVLLGKAGASGLDGKLVFNNATNSNTLTIVTGVTAASGGSGYTLTLPTTGASSSGQCLQSDTGSTVSSTSLTFSSCGAGGGTFATTYSTTSQASNTIAYSNSGGGALIIQNASTPLSTVLSIDTASSTFHYLQLNLASSIPHLQVFGASSTAYADIYYDAGASTAHFTASTGTTQIGTGSGAVNITAGTGSAVAITGDANSTFTTTTGLVRLDGPSGVELGTASSRNGDLKFINLTNTNIIDLTVPSGASAPGASYTLTLPGSVGSPNQCLQNSGTAGILTFNACGSGSGDNITVNSTAATDANFLDVAATGTIAGTTWTLNTATNPDNITLAISTASASTAGIVSNTTQTFAGAKTFQSNAAGGFIVQDSANSKNILSVDTSGDQVVLGVAGTSGVNGKIVFNTTNASNASVTLVSQSTATSYSIVLPSATAGGTNYCLVGTNASGTTTTSWVPCGSGSTGKITLTPEYPGAVMTADGSGNTGTMTSDFCSGSSLRNIPSTSNPCGASEEHNFYTWVTTSQNDYDIWIRWQVPSDFSDFAASNAIQMYGWRTDNTATTSVTLSAYNSSGSQCGTSTNVATGTATWTQTSMGGTVTAAGCTISAGNVIDLRIQMAANNKTVRAGEITINYQRN